LLLLNPEGQEIDRVIGFDGNRDEYFQRLQDFEAGNGSLLSLLERLEENPDDVETNFKIGKRYIDRYEWEKVQPYFLKVLETDPDDEKGFRSEATYNLSVYETRINGNIEPLQKFIAGCTESELLYRSYGILASHFIQKERFDEALALYEEALGRLPQNADLMADYAMFVFTSKIEGKYELGYERAKKAMTLKPEDEEVLFNSLYSLIAYYRNTENLEEYFATYKEALAKMPNDTFFMYGYAEALLRTESKDKYDEGIEIVKKALELEPEAPHLWHTLGKIYFEKGDMERAIEAAQKAVDIVPQSKQYQETLDKFIKAKEEN
jgi:tetratricopeptide (TPR) repeat protein